MSRLCLTSALTVPGMTPDWIFPSWLRELHSMSLSDGPSVPPTTPRSVADPERMTKSVPSGERIDFSSYAGAGAFSAPASASGAAIARSAAAAKRRRARSVISSCPQVDDFHQRDLREVVLQRREIGVIARQRLVLVVRFRGAAHLRVRLGEQVVRVLDDVLASEFLAEAERADSPVLRLVEPVELDVREAEVERRVVHRLPRPEAVEDGERAVDERKSDLDPIQSDVAVAQVVGRDRRLAREARAVGSQGVPRLLEGVPGGLEAALVELEVREQVERGAGELLVADVAALGERGLSVEEGAAVLAPRLVRVGGDVGRERSVVARGVAKQDLLQPRHVEVPPVHLDQGGGPVAGEEVLEVPVLPGAGERQPVVVEGQGALVVAGPDRVPGGLAQKLQMFTALAHRRNRISDSRGSRR